MRGLGKIVYFAIYSGLAFTACSILFFGPVTNILEDETVFTENLKTLNGKSSVFFNSFNVSWEIILWSTLRFDKTYWMAFIGDL